MIYIYRMLTKPTYMVRREVEKCSSKDVLSSSPRGLEGYDETTVSIGHQSFHCQIV